MGWEQHTAGGRLNRGVVGYTGCMGAGEKSGQGGVEGARYRRQSPLHTCCRGPERRDCATIAIFILMDGNPIQTGNSSEFVMENSSHFNTNMNSH